MSDAPKHDYEALLRELRGTAEATFPGWAEFVRTMSAEHLAEQQSSNTLPQ